MMHAPLRFTIEARSATTQARAGRILTPHGTFDTPAFMPVGTRASVKGLLPALVRQTGSQVVLGNAFHLMLRPGEEVIARLGGLHRFMGWDGPMLTDSGGYQAFSMADINALDEEGVTFASIIDGSRIRLTPERSIEVQNSLGADIIMAFDDCPPARGGDDQSPHRVQEAMERTSRWLERCIAAHRRPDAQSLFGIVQGGTDLALRSASVEAVCGHDLPGFAIGGVAVGERPEQIHAVVAHTAPRMPDDRPRYLMGVGYERDIVEAVRAGVDMFDCVLPTRNGRNANGFTRHGRIHLRNACYREDPLPIEPGCDCLACTGGPDPSLVPRAPDRVPGHGAPPGTAARGVSGGFSRAYLRHLFVAGEMLGPILLSIHNIRHFQRLMLDIRRAIREDAWPLLERSWPVLGAAARPVRISP
jgi:queuine tRNA-ribosyltransferase